MLKQSDLNVIKQYLSFWDNLSEAERTTIISHTTKIKYRQGQRVHSAEQECVGVLLMLSGELRTYLLSDQGKEVTLYRLQEGEVCILSASCLLHEITFDVFIDAQQESEVLLISSPVFSHLMKQNCMVENFALHLAMDRFSDVMWAMQQILFMSFDARLAVFLLDECSRMKTTTLSMTQEQIAKHMGSAREVVSRMLNYFAKEGIVKLVRGGICILDKQRLRSISDSVK